MTKKSPIVLRLAERFLLAVGLVLLSFYVLARIQGVVALHAAMRSFEESREAPGNGTSEDALDGVNYSLWSPTRVKAYKASLIHRPDPPLAVLRIPKLRIVAPVLNGTDDVTLNGGVGRIPGTALPGEPGNIGIAGHRDSFFRALKDIAKGDTIELVTKHKTDFYVVDKVYVTNPDDINILRPGRVSALTLVTCYPFYYVGSAPQRYIVQAVKQPGTASGGR